MVDEIRSAAEDSRDRVRSVLVAASVALIVVVSVVTRAGAGTWSWRADGGAAIFDGVPMHWEWIDVADPAWFLERDTRWTERSYNLLSDRLSRFVAPLSITIAGAWIGNAWRAAVALTLACWLVAAVATYQLAHRLVGQHARGRRVAEVAAVLVALSPGFSAYVGNIEARPFAYAAVPLALLSLERAWQHRLAAIGPTPHTRFGTDLSSHPVVVGAALFLANGTLEIGPPLLLLLYLFYVLPALSFGWTYLRKQARWAGEITLSYVVLSGTWWALSRVAALGRVGMSEDNDAWHKLLKTVTAGDFTIWDLTARLWNIEVNMFPAFTGPVLLLLVPGLFFLPRRVAMWAIAWIGIVVASIVLTRYYPRTIYLAYPAMYVAAAAAVEGAGHGSVTRGLPGAPALARAVVSIAPLAVLVLLVGARVFADLSGDLSLARLWWPGH
jgi:hypothetical protein